MVLILLPRDIAPVELRPKVELLECGVDTALSALGCSAQKVPRVQLLKDGLNQLLQLAPGVVGQLARRACDGRRTGNQALNVVKHSRSMCVFAPHFDLALKPQARGASFPPGAVQHCQRAQRCYQGRGVGDVSVNLAHHLVIARDEACLELVEFTRRPVGLRDDVAAESHHAKGTGAEDLVGLVGCGANARPLVLIALHSSIAPCISCRLSPVGHAHRVTCQQLLPS